MKTVGIIAEYNPFHAGHKYHIEKTKEVVGDCQIIAVMSGNFVQRGEPAILNKYCRAKMAILGGIDLVIELPTIFACNDASQFAKGAISLFDKLGIVDVISFGSESDDLIEIKKIADLMATETDEFKEELKINLKQGLSYPRARECALTKLLGHNCAKILHGSNNILAIEYLKELIKLKSSIECVSVKRYGAAYNDDNISSFPASATAIRNSMDKFIEISTNNRNIPPELKCAYKEINGSVKAELNDFYDLFRYKILTTDKNDLEKVYAAGEGLTNRIKDNIVLAETFDELTEKVISKRYTKTRLQRLYIQLLLEINKMEYINISKDGAQYARVLSFNEKGAAIIKQIKKSKIAEIPIITNINKECGFLSDFGKKSLDIDILACDLYNLALGYDLYENSEYIRKPVMV